jgi:hypothetical protein
MDSKKSLPVEPKIDTLVEAVARQKARHLKTAAFREWLHKLNRNDQLPRGRFFRDKKPGPPRIIMDEAHTFYSSQLNNITLLGRFY